MARPRTGDEVDEGYFASVSDLMVGVLFVFLLMLTVFALNFRDAEQDQVVERAKYEQAQRALTAARAEAERAQRQAILLEQRARAAQIEAEAQKVEAARQKAEATRQKEAADRQQEENERLRALLQRAMAQLERDIEDRTEARNRLLSSMEQTLRDRGVRVVLDQRSGILRLSGDLLFPTGSSALGPDARRTVQVLADVMSHILPCYISAGSADGCASRESLLETVLVEGHTDRQRFANVDATMSQDRNDRLSADRALSVFLELRRAQPELDAMRNGEGLPLLGVSGYGERRPLPEATCSSEGNCADNRRIDLRFVLSARSSDELGQMREEIAHALEQPP